MVSGIIHLSETLFSIIRPTTQSQTSVQLLVGAFSRDVEDNALDSTSPGNSVISPENSTTLSGNSTTSPVNSATLSGGSLKFNKDQDSEFLDQNKDESDVDKLKELVRKFELSNKNLSSKLQLTIQANEILEASIAEKESTIVSARQKLKESEKLVSSLQNRISNLENSKEAFENEKLLNCQCIGELEERNRKAVEKLKQMSENVLRLTQGKEEADVKCGQLLTEKEKLLNSNQELNELIGNIKSEHAQTIVRLNQDLSRLHDQLSQIDIDRKNEGQALQAALANSNSEKSQLMESNKELLSTVSASELRLSELRTEKQRLEGELQSYIEDQKEGHSIVYEELTVTKRNLQESENHLALCKAELDLIKNSLDGAHDEIRLLKEKLTREQQSCLLVQATMNSNKLQLESVDNKRRDLRTKLDESEAEKQETTAELKQTKLMLLDREDELASAKSRYESELKHFEEKIRFEADRALTAEQKASTNEAEVGELKKILKSTLTQMGELEDELSKRKMNSLASDGRLHELEYELTIAMNRLKEVSVNLQVSREEMDGIKENYEHKLQERQAKLEKVLKEHEDEIENWSMEKDGYIKRTMELERELKELQREVGQVSPPKKQVIHRDAAAMTTSAVSTPSSESLELIKNVALHRWVNSITLCL